MLRNFITVAFRSIGKNIPYVLINITGLGLALAICIVAYLNYKFDREFDRCHENRDRIYRIEHTQQMDGKEKRFAATPVPLGPSAVKDISGIKKMVRITRDLVGTLVKAGENEKYAGLIYADPDIFEVFGFPLISGSYGSSSDDNTIVITEQLAKFLFGDQNPLGESVTVWDSPYTVTGVLENHPLNSSFQFEAVVPINSYFNKNHTDELSWGNMYGIPSTFILVTDQKQTGAIEKLLQQYVPLVNEVNYHQVKRFYLAPFAEMAHQGRSVEGHPFRLSLHPAAVLPPAIAAICILLIACFNFTGTTIAMAGQRLKEIGVRKVVGCRRPQLILQWMSEGLLQMMVAFIMALFFAHYLVPIYSNMWDFLDLSFSLTQAPELWGFLFIILFVVVMLAGAYPALYISGFDPVTVLRDKAKLRGSSVLSRVILVLQFGISILALFTTMVFIQNDSYQEQFDPGYDGASVIEVHGENTDIRIFKNAITNHPDIESISESVRGPFFNSRSVKFNESALDANMQFLEPGAFRTLGLRLIEGRAFEQETSATDRASSVIVNRELVDELRITDPVGKRVVVSDTVPLTIIGVIENILEEGSMTTYTPPLFYRLAEVGYQAGGLYIRTLPEKRQKVQQYLEEEWDRLLPDIPFRAVEGNIYTEASVFIIKRILKISVFLVLIAILLSAAGLYSQLSLRIIHRTREIGIRKAFGASVSQMIALLYHEFLVLLFLGSIAGVTAGYLLNHALLESIWEYYMNMTILTFMIPMLGIFIFSWFLVSGKVHQAATRNPSVSLKYE